MAKPRSSADLAVELLRAHGPERALEIVEAIGGKGAQLQVRVSAAELATWRVAAKRAGQPLSAWVRDRLNATI